MIRSGIALLLCAVSVAGCGYTEQEWQALLDKNKRLDQRERVASAKNDELEAAIKAEKARVVDLEGRLAAMGYDVSQKDAALSNATATLADRERALKEYQERAQKLEAMRARFEALKTKLDELTTLGIEVRVRKNRMVISLPGDVLFDSGKDKLKKPGKEVLAKVAAVLKSDASLASRDYQVAGHTDSKALSGGNFGDNWGLSLMRARQVLLYLTAPGDGGLPKEHWSAAGYADTDPIATNDTDAGRQANRRCDLVVVPSIDEMLDLRALASGSRAAATPAPPTSAAPPATVAPKSSAPSKTPTPPKTAAPPATVAPPPSAPPAKTAAPPASSAPKPKPPAEKPAPRPAPMF